MKMDFKINYIYSLINNLFSFLYPVLILPYITKIFSVENIGIKSYVTLIISYFVLIAELGTNLYGTRLIAFNQDKKKYLKKYLNEIFFLKLYLVILCLIFFFIYNIFINKKYNLYIYIMSLIIIAKIFDVNWFFSGVEKFKEVFIRNIFIKLISLFLIFLFIKEEKDFVLLLVIIASSELIGNLFLFYKVKKDLKSLYLFKIKNLKIHFFKSLYIFIPRVLDTLYVTLDKFMLSQISNLKELSYYDITQMVVKIPQIAISSLSNILFSKMSYLFSKKEQKDIEEYMTNSIIFCLLICIPIIFGIFFLKKELILIFLGKKYIRIEKILFMSCFIMFFNSISLIIKDQYLLPSKLEKKISKILFISILLNTFFNTIFIHKYGAFGALFSSLISEIFIFAMFLKLTYRVIILANITLEFFKILVSSIGISSVIFVIKKYIIFNSFLKILILCIFCILLYIVLLIILKEKIIFLYLKLKRR